MLFGDSRLPGRFWAKTVISASTGCWLWRGARNPEGYGTFCVETKKNVNAHRHAYLVLIGPIEAGKELDHFACDNSSCCNPLHLRPVSHIENVRRMHAVGRAGGRAAGIPLDRQHCRLGHAYDSVDSAGCRRCKTCARERMRGYRANARMAVAS